ncbi:MAG: hypothetical protein DDT24_00517 [Chloroflexi bacterium]|nr:hypothetical protein [Chloroflexota bacterium]
MVKPLVPGLKHHPVPVQRVCHSLEDFQKRPFGFQRKGGAREILNGMSYTDKGLQRVEGTNLSTLAFRLSQDIE